MEEKNIALGADIGGGHIQVAAVDIVTGRLIETSAVYRKVNSKGTADEILDCWADALKESLQYIDFSGLKGIGFAMPGPFNYQMGVALFEHTDKYEALYGLHVTTLVQERLRMPLAIRYMNDASAFAVGEAWVGQSSGARRSMVITLGTGMGSAFVEGGIPVIDHPDVPTHGCLWHLPYADGIADDYFSTRWFVKAYEAMTGVQVTGVKAIVDLADDHSRQLLHQFGANLGAFLRPWVERFRPEVLVFGGSISRSLDGFLPSFAVEIQSTGCPVGIVRSELHEQAAILGSARLFEASFWEQVKDRLPVR